MSHIDQKYQTQLLIQLGEAAYGKSWKASLADNLPVARPTITDWITGKKPIPVGVWADIQTILNDRMQELQIAVTALSGQKHLIVIAEMLRKDKVVIHDAYADYLNSFSDDEILQLLECYKKENARCAAQYPNDTFADLSSILDAIQFQIVVRNINGNLDLSIAEDCAISYQSNLRLAQSFGLDAMFMIERTKEILTDHASQAASESI